MIKSTTDNEIKTVDYEFEEIAKNYTHLIKFGTIDLYNQARITQETCYNLYEKRSQLKDETEINVINNKLIALKKRLEILTFIKEKCNKESKWESFKSFFLRDVAKANKVLKYLKFIKLKTSENEQFAKKFMENEIGVLAATSLPLPYLRTLFSKAERNKAPSEDEQSSRKERGTVFFVDKNCVIELRKSPQEGMLIKKTEQPSTKKTAVSIKVDTVGSLIMHTSDERITYTTPIETGLKGGTKTAYESTMVREKLTLGKNRISDVTLGKSSEKSNVMLCLAHGGKNIDKVKAEAEFLDKHRIPGTTRQTGYGGIEIEGKKIYFQASHRAEHKDLRQHMAKKRKEIKRKERDAQESLKEDIQIMLGVLSATIEIHSRKFVHRDMKPNNILIYNKGGQGIDIAVIDLECICKQNPEEWKSLAGTTAYLPPEYIKEYQKYGGVKESITPAMDVWALGLMFFEMTTGDKFVCDIEQFSFYEKNLVSYIQAFHDTLGDRILTCTDTAKKAVLEAILPMINLNLEERPSARKVRRTLARIYKEHYTH